MNATKENRNTSKKKQQAQQKQQDTERRAAVERLSLIHILLAPDGSFFCTAYERDTAAELLLRFGPDGSEAGRWRMSELIPCLLYTSVSPVTSFLISSRV